MQAALAAAAGAGIAAVAGTLATLAWIALAKRWRIEDAPGQRRLHADATPRGAGVALAVAWWLGVGLACLWVYPAPWPLYLLVIVTGPFLLCGLIDDFVDLGAPAKLALQVVAVAAAFAPAYGGGGWGMLAVIGIAWLYFVNAWNFMDGSNGMIALQSLLVAFALATWPGQQPEFVISALALAGACLGFLPLNFPRARVFLGDAGSLLLGAALFYLLVASTLAGVMAPVQALLLASVVLVDTAMTLARRIVLRRRFWQAHREHLYQYAVRLHGHAKPALAYAAATVLAWLLALSLQGRQGTILAIVVPTLAWVSAAAVYLLLRRHWLGRGKHPSMEGKA